MPQKFDVIDVINALGLEINPRQSTQQPSFNVRCPFCGDTKFHMNINAEKDLYKCRFRGVALCTKSRFGFMQNTVIA